MRLNHDQDPTLTHHARTRAAEMGLPLEAVLAIYRDPSVVRPTAPRRDQDRPGNPRSIVKSDRHPGYALCVAQDPYTGQVWVCSVLFDTGEAAYVRTGTTATIQEN